MISIDNIKNKVYYFMLTDRITNYDIINLSNFRLEDLHNLNTKNSYKARLLLSIYINPYLLCNDELVILDNFDLDSITKLVIKRYNEEVYEYNIRLECGDITYTEYNNRIQLLNNLYFKSSNIGRKIGIINRKEIIEKVKTR